VSVTLTPSEAPGPVLDLRDILCAQEPLVVATRGILCRLCLCTREAAMTSQERGTHGSGPAARRRDSLTPLDDPTALNPSRLPTCTKPTGRTHPPPGVRNGKCGGRENFDGPLGKSLEKSGHGVDLSSEMEAGGSIYPPIDR
jgi:hypothetical protein